MFKVKHVGEITLYVVDDEALVGILEKLGIYQDADAGKLQCYLCGRAVSVQNLGGIFKHEGQVRVTCNSIKCLYEAAVLTARQFKARLLQGCPYRDDLTGMLSL